MVAKARRDQRDRQNMTVGDRLFKEVISDEEDDHYLFDECMMEGGGSKRQQKGKPRAYTLCMIANPAGYDQTY